MQEYENRLQRAWARFEETGKVGAYLMYRAIRSAAQRHE